METSLDKILVSHRSLFLDMLGGTLMAVVAYYVNDPILMGAGGGFIISGVSRIPLSMCLGLPDDYENFDELRKEFEKRDRWYNKSEGKIK